MKNIWYILFPEVMKIYGPMSFKEALKYREKYGWAYSSRILKIVIDENGKEVK